MSFVRRYINLTFRLGQGEFGTGPSGGDGFNTVKLPPGLRTQARITQAGDASQTELKLQVYGVPLDIMNKLSVLGKPIVAGALNTVVLEVSDDDNPTPVTAFVGTIFQAWADIQNPPDGLFQVSAQLGFIDALRPVAPTSFKGSAQASLIMQGLAKAGGYVFQNNGVTTVLSNQYLSGTLRDQMKQLAANARFHWVIEDNTVVIWPPDGTRTDVPTAQMGPDTGLIGYPVWTDGGVIVRSLYNPGLRFGSKMTIKSDITQANGDWTIYRVEHELDTETPEGRWFTTSEATFFGRASEVASA